MGRVLLCVGNYAKTPYRLNKICMNVWCVEELCYLFLTNPFMIDKEIVDKKLADWIDEECGLTELSHRLYTLFHKGNSVSIFVSTILEYVNYCTKEEQKQIIEVLQNNTGLSEFEKKKKQADYLVTNRKYHMAIVDYSLLLDELPEAESEMRPKLLHNRGIAYAGLFLFEKAAENLQQAYELTKSAESGMQFLYAKRQSLNENEYIGFIAEHPEYHKLSLMVEKQMKEVSEQFDMTDENRMLFALRVYKDEGKVTAYYDEIEAITAKLKADYRDYVEY